MNVAAGELKAEVGVGRPRWLNSGRLGMLVSVLALAACSSTPPLPEPVAESPRVEPRVEAAPAQRAEPEQLANGSHTFKFDTMSVALADSDKLRLAGLAGQARTARNIVIRGSCDRTMVGNAKEAAIARALAVRTVLVQEGVPAAKIRVRYSTEDGLHAAVLRLN
ncbi:OmpA family protein [Azoarcus sp. DD4]|uniref:OmpA family protein n=1 Tax=Azoarcus sp. DD4 TaxID=2027405 RepID=UPI00143DB9DC|nr:OmpA family protein [Azoarcus sp. DD4]